MKATFVITRFLPLLVASAMLTGCATPALWAKKMYRPADHPHLALAFHPESKDVLVCYDERCGKSCEVRRRAYWLFANTAHPQKRSKPVFVDPEIRYLLGPIQVLNTAKTNLPPNRGYCAFADSTSATFHLRRDEREIGVFSLPRYEAAPPATFWRIGLTPVTVATDAAIIGLFCMGQAAH